MVGHGSNCFAFCFRAGGGALSGSSRLGCFFRGFGCCWLGCCWLGCCSLRPTALALALLLALPLPPLLLALLATLLLALALLLIPCRLTGSIEAQVQPPTPTSLTLAGYRYFWARFCCF